MQPLKWTINFMDLFNQCHVGDDPNKILFKTTFKPKLIEFLTRFKHDLNPFGVVPIVLMSQNNERDYAPIIECLNQCQKSALYGIDLTDVLKQFNVSKIQFTIELNAQGYDITKLAKQFIGQHTSTALDLLELTNNNLYLIDPSLISLTRSADHQSIEFFQATALQSIYIGSKLSNSSGKKYTNGLTLTILGVAIF